MAELAVELKALRQCLEHGQAGKDGALFTREEAAEFLRLSVPQLDNLAREHKITRIKIGEGPPSRVLYRKRDLDAFVEANIEPVSCDQIVSTNPQ
jgi:excisionase family DNA binding protein